MPATDDPTALARIDAQGLLQTAVEKGAPIETLERLIALAERVRAMQAREAWYDAMAKFQATCPPIFKTRPAKIATRQGGSFTYTFAPLDEIMETIQPVMGPLGLSVSWPRGNEPVVQDTKVVVRCRVSHRLGHYEESDDLPMPIPTEGGANAMQRVGIALSYGRRYSLLSIIGKAPETDTDGHVGDGAPPEEPDDAHAPPSGNTEAVISDNQANRLSAIARGARWSDEDLHALIQPYASRKDIRVADYGAIVEIIKAGPEAWRKTQAAP